MKRGTRKGVCPRLIAVAVSGLNPNSLDLTGVHPSSDLPPPTMPIETRIRVYWGRPQRTSLDC